MGQAPVPAVREMPGGALHLFQLQRIFFPAADDQPPAQKRQTAPAPVMHLHGHIIGRVPECHGQVILFQQMPLIDEPQTPAAVRKMCPQDGIAPVSGLHGGKLGQALCQVIHAAGSCSGAKRCAQRHDGQILLQCRSPVQMPYPSVFCDAEGVGHFRRGQMEYTVFSVKMHAHERFPLFLKRLFFLCPHYIREAGSGTGGGWPCA